MRVKPRVRKRHRVSGCRFLQVEEKGKDNLVSRDQGPGKLGKEMLEGGGQGEQQSCGRSSPLLEQAHTLATTVTSPQVTPARRLVATVAGSMVTVSTAPDASPPVNLDQRGAF